MLYLICAILFGLVGAALAAYWTRDEHLGTDDYIMGAVLIGIFGGGWFITVPTAAIIGVTYYVFKFFRKVVKGDIKFVSDEPTL